MTQTFPQDELTMVSIRNPLNTCIFAPMVEINPYQHFVPDHGMKQATLSLGIKRANQIYYGG